MIEKYKVDVTATAESDISEIWGYISSDSPSNADAFISQIENQIASLESHPDRCSLIPENEILGTSYRHLVYGNYRTIFKKIEKRVVILSVVHRARLLDMDFLADV